MLPSTNAAPVRAPPCCPAPERSTTLPVSLRPRPRLLIGSVRNQFGSRRRRGYRIWAPLPERAASDAGWWADDPRWFPAGTPPRPNTRVDLLIDGQETFRAAWEAIRRAEHSVWLVDWAMDVEMPLIRDEDTAEIPPAQGPAASGYRVLDLLTAAASHLDVRALIWNGSLLFRPNALVLRAGLRRMRAINPKVRAEADRQIGFTHCHHQKAIVVDGRIAFVGGLDMADFDIDRWDRVGHPLRAGLNWHDLCLRLEGEAARDVGRNFVQRWEHLTKEPLSLPDLSEAQAAPGDAAVQVVRTIPARVYPFAPHGEYGIAWAYQQAFRQAKRFIYLENQYLWSPAVVDELTATLRRVEDPDFRLVLVLPARPNIGKKDTDVHVRQLLEAEGDRGRVLVFSLYTAGPEARRKWIYKPIYVHAKVAIIDDEWLTVGSANLNGRGMEGDSELNVQVQNPVLARALRLRLWSEHLGLPEETIATLQPVEAIDRFWVPFADHAHTVVERRGGALRTSAYPYQRGSMPADLTLGELQARLLDR